MARRPKQRTIKRLRVTLANGEVAVRGQRAHGNTADGLVYATPAAITTLIPIGYFTEDVTGDGVATTLVDLFDEVLTDGWNNDSGPNDVQAGDIFKEVFLKDETTVSTSDAAGTRSKAGRVMFLEDGRVYLQQGLAVAGPTGASVGSAQGSGVADKAALAAIVAASRFDGMLVLVRADGSLFRFDSASAAAEDEGQELVVAPDAGTGRWLRADKSAILKLPVDFSMADGAAIFTVPTGFVLRLTGLPFWEVGTAWTGGASSTIGIASSVAGYTVAGDILGGAAGDAAAGLTAGIKPGTVGAALDTEAERQAFLLQAADTLTYEEITSAFTAGAGSVCLPVAIAHPA